MIEIAPLLETHLPTIVKIHINELKNDFLPSLGEKFLLNLYKGAFKSIDTFGFVALEGKKVVGFIVGTKNMKTYLSSSLKSNLLRLSYYLGIRLLEKPFLIKNALETLTYSSKDIGPPSELVVIAVSKKYQSLGIGKKLVQALEREFKDNKISRYKLTVHADKKAVYFYEGLGYDRLSQFSLYNKLWYIYEKRLER